jgi:parallel beta-helix repeat protein
MSSLLKDIINSTSYVFRNMRVYGERDPISDTGTAYQDVRYQGDGLALATIYTFIDFAEVNAVTGQSIGDTYINNVSSGGFLINAIYRWTGFYWEGYIIAGDYTGKIMYNITTGVRYVFDSGWNELATLSYQMVVAASDATDKEKNGADYICDGIADEVEILQASIDLAGLGEVVLTSGNFNISTGFNLNTGLRGQGVDTILKPDTGSGALGFMINFTSGDIDIQDFYVNAGGANADRFDDVFENNTSYNNFRIKNLTCVEVNSFFYMNGAPTTAAWLQDCNVTGKAGNTLAFFGRRCSNMNIEGNYIAGFKDFILTAGSSDVVENVILVNNKLINVNRGLYRATSNNVVQGNYLKGDGSANWFSPQTIAGSDNKIIGNTFDGFGAAVDLGSTIFNNTVIGNTFLNITWGVYMRSATVGNVVSNNIIESPTTAGIRCDGTDNIISSNVIRSAPSLLAINLSASSGYNQVSNNKTNIGSLVTQITEAGNNNNLVNNI